MDNFHGQLSDCQRVCWKCKACSLRFGRRRKPKVPGLEKPKMPGLEKPKMPGLEMRLATRICRARQMPEVGLAVVPTFQGASGWNCGFSSFF